MATIPTNNDIPSESPQDLAFNAGKIDEVVNSPNNYYSDRFGVQRWTFRGISYTASQAIAQFGYIVIDSFQLGATLTLPNQVLRDTSTGEYYRWDGAYPKTVASGSTPATSGGTGTGKWLSVGDATLRSELISTGLPFLVDDSRVLTDIGYSGSIQRSQKSRNYLVSVKDFGAIGDGVTDDTAAFQAAVNTGLMVDIGYDKYLVGNVTFPSGSGLVGRTPQPHEVHLEIGESYFSLKSLIVKKSGTTFTLGRGCFIRDLTMIKQGTPSTITTNVQAAAAIAGFADKAITSIEPDVYVENVLVLGFQYAFYALPTLPTTGRRTFTNFRGDCTNGIYLAYGLDIDRFKGCHFWPYLTAHLAEATTDANLRRSGKAYWLSNIADWSQIVDCFSYGYDVGIHLNGTNNVTIIGGGADAVTSAGILVDGTARFNKASYFFINSNAICISVNTSGANPDFKTDHCVFNGQTYGVYVTAGSYFSSNDTFMGATGLAFTTGTITGSVNYPFFDGVVTPVVFGSGTTDKVSFHAPVYAATQPFTAASEMTFSTGSRYIDKRAVGAGVGHFFEQGGNYNAGIGGYWRVGPRLSNATTGTEQSDYTFTTYNLGTWADRFVMQGNQIFRPVSDGVALLGGPSNRWGQIYSSVGTISTSTRELKTEEEDLNEIEKRVAMKCKSLIKKFRFKDAVEEKGAGARIHFGIIAEDVKEAFESEGLIAEEYGIFCFDQWDDIPAVFDDEGNELSPEKKAGTRSGIRYDELSMFILSAI